MADALDKIRAGVDKARTKLAAQRLGGREWDVYLVPTVPGDRALGLPSTAGTPVLIAPRPEVTFKAVMAMTDAGLIQVGDCVVAGISRAGYTVADLRGAEDGPAPRWRIDGRDYTFVDVVAKPLEFVVTLQREGES